ncbi:FMN-binding protein [Marinilabilia rubra]|uniref:FMN-binding domain-containing protein n=1 Tax=Marinilabilia rubra TaxID=2162893 RepID=A0A2U2BDM5_9BACT|nr:FMN-binding protein [Marinilabilia rubra]PWE01174.1 hypothetical protein DDZ16_01420 [Marinilabilia rubra]
MTFFTRHIAIAILVIISLPAVAQNNLLNKKNLKSINKAIEKLYDEVPDYKLQETANEYPFEILKIYISDSTETSGYAIIAQGKGRRNYFDFMVIYTDGVIRHLEILQYRSSHGYQITSKSWLKDFIGVKSGEEIRIGNDVDAISGATLSSHGLLKVLNKINKINFE